MRFKFKAGSRFSSALYFVCTKPLFLEPGREKAKGPAAQVPAELLSWGVPSAVDLARVQWTPPGGVLCKHSARRGSFVTWASWLFTVTQPQPGSYCFSEGPCSPSPRQLLGILEQTCLSETPWHSLTSSLQRTTLSAIP